MQTYSVRDLRAALAREGALFPIALSRRTGGAALKVTVPLVTTLYLVFDPASVQDVLVRQAEHTRKARLIVKVLRSSFGNGIFTSDGAFWRRQRKLMQPTFHHAHLARYAERMVAYAARLGDAWQHDTIVDIDADMHDLTLRIVLDALFSHTMDDESAPLYAAMRHLSAGIAAQGRFALLTFLPDWTPLPSFRRKRHGVAVVKRLIGRLVAARRAQEPSARPHDLLTALLEARDSATGEMMDDTQVYDELMTLYIAGHETTAVLMGWVWAMLAQHPHAEAALHAELDRVLGGRLPTSADLPQLPYTQNVIKETLRLYPSAWFVMREVLEPFTLEGERVPQGALLMLLPVATHRDPRYYDQPDAFLPERWQNGLEQRLPRGAYFPFGMGARVCIGNGFAMMEAQLLLATLAQQFHVQLLTPPQPTRAIGTLGFAYPMRARLLRRAHV